jgi:hypothetical protein
MTVPVKTTKVIKPKLGTAALLRQMSEEIAAGIPKKELIELPRDGAKNHDHYLYGSPKRR